MKLVSTLILVLFSLAASSQKKPLDHSVYDSWQSIGERMISNDGKWVVYSITPQEGDATLYVQSADGRFKKEVPRGYNALITEDSRFAVFKIRPLYKDTRDARIKKKRPDEFPKDSLGIIELGKDNILKLAKIRSYKAPEKAGGWLAYQKEREPSPASPASAPTQKTVDSLRRTIDSLVLLVTQVKNAKAGNADARDADDDPIPGNNANPPSDLVLRDLSSGKERVLKNVSDYVFSENGQKLVVRIAKMPRENASINGVVLINLNPYKADTIMKNGNDFKNFAMSRDGSRLAFVAERDTNTKALQKFYSLYVYRSGDDSASLLVDKKSVGMDLGTTVSENGLISFSRSGNRLMFGTAAIQPPKDTSLVDIDLVKVDIWHYNDDYLQTQQLFQLNNELKRSYSAVYNFSTNTLTQFGSTGLPSILPTNEGDGETFYAITDTGRRVQSQWEGSTKKDVYAIDVRSGKRTLIRSNFEGNVFPSSTGKYALLYDPKIKNYWCCDGNGLKNITSKIKTPLYNEEQDTPDDPNPYGVMGWHAADSFVYVYDRYDAWKVDPTGVKAPVNFTVVGRPSSTSYRYARLNEDERFISDTQTLFFRYQHNNNKKAGIALMKARRGKMEMLIQPSTYSFGSVAKSKNSVLLFSRENYTESPNLYVASVNEVFNLNDVKPFRVELSETKLTNINPQQSQFIWGTAELFHWKSFDNKSADGILYKPEDFDSTKKYPMIIYFYERLTDGLFSYSAPSPTPSRLNIPFFVSRGYLVFAPDIRYTKGHPGKDAYNYIVSGAQALGKKRWVDAKNIGIQGQSWGGYQVAYLVTATNMFKAAWAGAPVVNMFSAYGGIRWESGNNRQFQYEKGQSRIGYTPWQRPDLYIENSPFFHLQKVQTPLVIMSNDADGAVPWYQGIEFFTAMRRLDKKVWLLNYNGEAHNLVERRNRKDIQIREQEYFDWLLKGARPARWLTEGVPAVKKGKDWGLEIVD